ncbi:hypothetical protein BDA96_08G150600 [Sorghum bicolor]|uniref:Uncharacterized protein n=2 Tax=Sorghum bicolor TaxID=4558 RepID=A0A921QJ41_SORBI|nr:uncharacterized protein LOC110429809 [Sorghum bicolor]KAG0521325.1 hypothetical protein BDA96_08G150600 [Sorghum bicolor]KXG23755.1 hypothetical protein SORBI_3008G136400 [Sorghum bicolor]|eukprot:XP_021302125.1 uncharacterized protein LOC110429809 [Sorghum bicolor]
MQDMAGSDGMQTMQLPPLRDLSRRAVSFLRMARLALTGAATPAQLLAGEEVVDGISCNPYYKRVSTEDDWESELWPEEDESEELLVDDDEDGSTTRGASDLVGGGVVGGPLNKKAQFRHQSTATPGAHVTAAEPEEPSEPLMTRRATKRVNDAAVAVDHPFGCDRQGRESSSLLLVSS